MLFVDIDLLLVYFRRNFGFNTSEKVFKPIDKYRNFVYNNVKKICARCDDEYYI